MIQAEFPSLRHLILLAVTSLALALAGCSGEEKPAAGGSASAKPAAGQSSSPIVVLIPADAVSLDPPRPTDGNSLLAIRHVFDTLTDFHGRDLKPVPGLAKSWDISEDGLTYTFRLRDNATFSDGTPVTAEDVAFTYQRLTDTNHPQHFPGIKWGSDILAPDWFDGVVAADAKTVVITLKRPYVPLLLNLAIPAAGIVSKAYTIKAGDEGTSTKPMGSGPYVLEEWRQGSYLKLRAREDHWRGKPKNAGLIFQPQSDANQTISALKRGDAHFAVVLSPVAMGGKDKDLGKAQLVEFPLPSIGYVVINCKKGDLVHKNVRLAMNYAIDRQALCDGLLEGTSIPATGVLPPGMLGYRENKPHAFTYDPEKAKQLLAEAGFGPGGNKLSFTFHTFDALRPYNVVGSRLAQSLQESLRQVGIETDIKLMEFGGLIEMLEEREVHELANIGWMTDNGDPDNFIYYLFGSPSNRSLYDNLEARALMEEAQGTVDEAKRAELYQRAEDSVLLDPPAILINHANAFKGVNKQLRGYIPHPLNDVFWNVYLE